VRTDGGSGEETVKEPERNLALKAYATMRKRGVSRGYAFATVAKAEQAGHDAQLRLANGSPAELPVYSPDDALMDAVVDLVLHDGGRWRATPTATLRELVARMDPVFGERFDGPEKLWFGLRRIRPRLVERGIHVWHGRECGRVDRNRSRFVEILAATGTRGDATEQHVPAGSTR
jgi:hypothetical protein